MILNVKMELVAIKTKFFVIGMANPSFKLKLVAVFLYQDKKLGVIQYELIFFFYELKFFGKIFFI